MKEHPASILTTGVHVLSRRIQSDQGMSRKTWPLLAWPQLVAPLQGLYIHSTDGSIKPASGKGFLVDGVSRTGSHRKS